MLQVLSCSVNLIVASAVVRTAVVTGGGSGIGKSLALELAARGTTTIIVGRREQLLLGVAKDNSNIRACVADIGSQEGQAAVRACVGEEPLHFLVHNAAIMPEGSLPAMGLSTWKTAMGANVDAPLFLTQALLPNLEKAGGLAKVLMISSAAADIAIPVFGAYCVSKASMKMLWKVMALEFLEKGVHVGYCLPGLVDTAMLSTVATTDGFRWKDVISGRIASGDVHTTEEVGQWLATLMDEAKVNSTLFREREHNIDMPGHDLGVKMTLTTEGKTFRAGNSDYSDTWDETPRELSGDERESNEL